MLLSDINKDVLVSMVKLMKEGNTIELTDSIKLGGVNINEPLYITYWYFEIDNEDRRIFSTLVKIEDYNKQILLNRINKILKLKKNINERISI